MITSLAVSLAGAVFAGRIAYRLTVRDGPSRAGRRTSRRRSPALALLGLSAYWHYMLARSRTR